MKIIKSLFTIVILAVFFTGSAFAYNAGNTAKDCKLPRFTDFDPPKKSKATPVVPEIEAESEVSFKVSGYADPTTIRAEAKKVKLKLELEDRNSFYIIRIKMLPEFTGKYVRINLWANAQTGGCLAKGGWLMKVKKAAEGVEAKTEKATATEKKAK